MRERMYIVISVDMHRMSQVFKTVERIRSIGNERATRNNISIQLLQLRVNVDPSPYSPLTPFTFRTRCISSRRQVDQKQ